MPYTVFMGYNPDIHHRRTIRLRGFDYASAGAYFVTLCVQGRECLFGEVEDGAMMLNDAGRMVEVAWRHLPQRFPHIALDTCVVMPNHMHGIVMINDTVGAGLGPPGLSSPNLCPADVLPSKEKGAASRAPTLGDIVCAFKSISTVEVNRMLSRSGVPLWQRNYFERIIRDDRELARAREYIATNPLKWELDTENPANLCSPLR